MYYCFLTLFLFACSDYSFKNELKIGPELVVYPDIIEFGHLKSGTESGQVEFAVINAGDEDLIISHPEIVSNSSKFSLDPPSQENYTISPGDTQEFSVYYVPETFESGEAIVTLVSNDEDENQYEIPVSGFGDAPVLSVTPEVFDYGQISIGCDNEERITIRNEGNLELVVENINDSVKQALYLLSKLDNCLTFSMSGSGPTCFALFKDVETAKKELTANYKLFKDYGYDSWVCTFLKKGITFM